MIIDWKKIGDRIGRLLYYVDSSITEEEEKPPLIIIEYFPKW